MLNFEQEEALNYIIKGESIFLTGSPGTGKSFTLKKIVEYLKTTSINYGITALTGAAAILINGQTLHSFLGIGLGNDNVDKLYDNVKKNKKKIYNTLKNLDLLIIDEISMMNNILFEKISKFLSKIKNNLLHFGNIKLLFIGDFHQLPPITGNYCFKSKIWNDLNLKNIVLKKSIRQIGDDNFNNILYSIRNGTITDNMYNNLLKLKETTFPDFIIPTKLYCLNYDVDFINKRNFNKQYAINKNIKLNTHNIEELINNDTIISNNSYDDSNNNDISNIYKYEPLSNDLKYNKEEYTITLLKYTQVMITRNININEGLVNGTRGYIIFLNKNYVIIKDINNKIHKINYFKDENHNKSTYILHMPIILAYALSIHKCQGSTLDAVEIDASSNNFASGQLYTALSRTRSLDNIKLINLDKKAFIVNNDVLEFYKNLKKYIS